MCAVAEGVAVGGELAVRQMQTTTMAAGWMKAAVELSSLAASLVRSGSAVVTRDRREAIAFVARNAGLRDDVLPKTSAGGLYAAERYRKAQTATPGKRIAPGTGVELTFHDVSSTDAENVVESRATTDRTETT